MSANCCVCDTSITVLVDHPPLILDLIAILSHYDASADN